MSLMALQLMQVDQKAFWPCFLGKLNVCHKITVFTVSIQFVEPWPLVVYDATIDRHL